MTKKNAALKTYVKWAWLENNPESGNHKYPLFEELGYDQLSADCPWCELFTGPVQSCHACPLYLDERNKKQCPTEGSLYYLWANNIDSAKSAGDIAATAWKEYKRLGG